MVGSRIPASSTNRCSGAPAPAVPLCTFWMNRECPDECNRGVARAATDVCAQSKSQSSRELPFRRVNQHEVREGDDNQKPKVGDRQPREAQKRADRRHRQRHADGDDEQRSHR